MKAVLKSVQGTTFAGKANSNHWAIIDNSEADDGAAAGSGPMEMVLMALGACSSVDILLMMKKMRATVTDFEVHLDSERAEEHPRVFTKVVLDFRLKGENIKPKDVERAINLSMDKYCSVAGMVSKTAEIETSYKILD